MDLAELERRASPVPEMQSRLLEQERRIRDLIDPPALRWLRDSELQLQKLAEMDRWTERLRSVEAEAERVRHLVEPSPIVAQMLALEQKRIATFSSWTEPVAELARTLSAMDRVGAVYRQINETAAARYEQLFHTATTAAAFASKIPEVGSVIREMNERTAAIMKSFTFSVAKDYSGVAAGFDTYLSATRLLPAADFLVLPGREFFVSADLLSAVTGRSLSRSDVDTAPITVRKRIDLYIYETLDEALTDFAPSLLSALGGARQIAVSANPDKIRHACVSLRTVTIGVLEVLAPADEVKKWSTRARDFHNGKPRTITRLRFIAQRIDSPELAQFMEADGKAICELIDVLHAGTHEVGLQMELRHLRYLFRRVESFLCAILEATLIS
jgi:flagellar motility protein MotE (MotC chaperone)